MIRILFVATMLTALACAPSAQASPGCDAAGLMNAVGAVSSGTSAWLASHPAAQDAINSANESTIQGYFVAHQDEWSNCRASPPRCARCASPARSRCPRPTWRGCSTPWRHEADPVGLPGRPFRLRRACARRADPLPRRLHGGVRAVLPGTRDRAMHQPVMGAS